MNLYFLVEGKTERKVVTRRRFEEILPNFGFSVLADDPETIPTELSA